MRVRKSIATLLLIVLGTFSLGQAVEVLHPVEETPHAEHPRVAGIEIVPLLCDAGSHAHRHLCLHGQQLSFWTQFETAVGSQVLDTIEAPAFIEPAGRSIVRFLRRGPPSC